MRRVSSSVFDAWLLLDAENDRRVGVVRPRSARDPRALAHGTDVADERRHGPGGLHRHGADGGDIAEPPHRANEVFLPLRDLKSRGRVLVGPGQRIHDIVDGDAVRRQPHRVDEHLVLLALAARGDDLRHAGDGQQTSPDHDLGGRAHVQRRVAVRFQVDEQDFAHDRRYGSQERRLDARRQRA